MQPYFIPYPGYFRLLAVSDLFVLYDCVQFPRWGWVHRNRLRRADGDADWLTLPLTRPLWPRRIDTLRLAPDAPQRLERAFRRFPALHTVGGASLAESLVADGAAGAPLLVDYLERQIRAIAALLGLAPTILRSSGLGLPEHLTGQDRVLAVCTRLGARRYVNAPGGRALYDAEAFARHGLTLGFLETWTGTSDSILQALATEDPDRLGRSIAGNSRVLEARPCLAAAS